jgi:hypothetical protein
LQPLVLVVPTFVLLSCLLAVGAAIVVFDTYKARKPEKIGASIQDHLLEASDATNVVAADTRSSLRQSVIAFCGRSFRSLIETCSSYVLMPCIFVFVVNVRFSSFAQAELSDRAMIVMLPIMMLIFRALVIRHRVVEMTSSDQKQLIAGSVCSCLNAAVLSVYFEQVGNARQLNPSFASETPPQYMVLALLATQVGIQTLIRHRSTEVSIFDNMTWQWSAVRSQSSSTTFPFDELEARLLRGSIKSASSTGAFAAVRFFCLNYLAISQIVMVTVGIVSSGATSLSSVQTSSVVIGSIPLVSSGALLLYNTANVAIILWKKCFNVKKAEPRLSEMESQY